MSEEPPITPTGDAMERKNNMLPTSHDFRQEGVTMGESKSKSYLQLAKENPNFDAWGFDALWKAEGELVRSGNRIDDVVTEESNEVTRIHQEIERRVEGFVDTHPQDDFVREYQQMDQILDSAIKQEPELTEDEKGKLYKQYKEYQDKRTPDDKIAKIAGEEKSIKFYMLDRLKKKLEDATDIIEAEFRETEPPEIAEEPQSGDAGERREPIIVPSASQEEGSRESGREGTGDEGRRAETPSDSEKDIPQMSMAQVRIEINKIKKRSQQGETSQEENTRYNQLFDRREELLIKARDEMEPNYQEIVETLDALGAQLGIMEEIPDINLRDVLDFQRAISEAKKDARRRDRELTGEMAGISAEVLLYGYIDEEGNDVPGIDTGVVGGVDSRVETLIELARDSADREREQRDADANRDAGDTEQSLSETLESLTKTMQDLQAAPQTPDSGMTVDDFIAAMRSQNQKLAEAFALFGERTPPLTERSRWVDMEYRQEFYTQFDPRSEPYFYKDIDDEQERRVWDYRWRLARIAFYKKATNALPEKYRDSQDVTLFTNEMINVMLERVEGTKEMMGGYTDEIVNRDSEFWRLIRAGMNRDSKESMNTERFDAYRAEMRRKHRDAVVLRMSNRNDIWARLSDEAKQELDAPYHEENNPLGMNSYQRASPDRQIGRLSRDQVQRILQDFEEQRQADPGADHLQSLKQILSRQERLVDGVSVDDWIDLKVKEADAVAWNAIYISDVVEWADSRFTISGGRHELPLILASDDYREVHHPLEKWINKSTKKHTDWSRHVEWGYQNLLRISEQYGVELSDLEEHLVIRVARNELEYWNSEQLDGDRIQVSVPPAYAPTAVESFFHKSNVLQQAEDGSWHVDLDQFRTFRPETLDTEAEHPFGLWVATKFHKAIKFNEYAKGKVDFSRGGDWTAYQAMHWQWADPLIDLHQRLGLHEKGLSNQQLKDMNNLIFIASLGGTTNPKNAQPKRPYMSFVDAAAARKNLTDRGLAI